MTLPLAHLGHFLWIFYVMPVVIVIAGIVRSTMKEKQREREEQTEDPPPAEQS